MTQGRLLKVSDKRSLSKSNIFYRRWTYNGSSPVTVNVCKCARLYTTQTTAITANGSRDTNVNAAVIYRIQVSLCYDVSFISVLSIVLLVTIRNFKCWHESCLSSERYELIIGRYSTN